jgi:CRP/FNR family transcriptional regulator, polysaccharide utilization system transcription regulator
MRAPSAFSRHNNMNKKTGNLNTEIPCFSTLTEEQNIRVQNSCYSLTYGIGEVLFKQGSPVSHIMYVDSGLVKIYKESSKGRSVIFDLVSSGAFITLLTVFGDDRYKCNAAAVEQTKVVLMDVSVMRELIRENGDFAGQLLRQTSQEGLNTITKLMSQFQKQLPGRVAEMLLFFSEKIYNSQTFNLPFTRRELAEFTGTTKESMIRTLSEFRHDKIINLDGKRVEIISPELIHTLSRLG